MPATKSPASAAKTTGGISTRGETLATAFDLLQRGFHLARAAHGQADQRGEHGEEDIPEILSGTDPEAVYTGPIGADPRIAGLLLDQIERSRFSHNSAAIASASL